MLANAALVCALGALLERLPAPADGRARREQQADPDIRDADGRPLRFGFFDFLPTGLVGFVIIEATAIGYAAWVLSRVG